MPKASTRFTALEIDVQMTDINSPAAPTSSTPCPTSQPLRPTPWSLPPVPPRLMSTDPLFIGHTFSIQSREIPGSRKRGNKEGCVVDLGRGRAGVTPWCSKEEEN
jgi:hypothetical protein